MTLQIYNRDRNREETELVYGDSFVTWLYGTKSGSILSHLLCKAPLSRLYGAMQNTRSSANKINPFIQSFNIPLDDFIIQDKTGAVPYNSFNDFFIRKFKPGKRVFDQDTNSLSAFAEARYSGFRKVSSHETYPVKGVYMTPDKIISDTRWDDTFKNGPMLIARLCPVDYHRFHFPDTCEITDTFRISGSYHSVNPAALFMKQDIFMTNERQVSILNTENFGYLAYIEVGAICVGKIIQTYNKQRAGRGDEKGYFLFGASTVIVIGEENRWTPSPDILKHTSNNMETLVKLGDSVAVKTT